MPSEPDPTMNPGEVAAQIAHALDVRKTDYALGGAIALGYWGQPRGTMDVDLTLFLSIDQPSVVVWELQEIGCEVQSARAIASLQEHGFCTATFSSCRVDIFVPTIPFYEQAKARRRRVQLGDQQVLIWDAETLSVFKMMFFRPRDFIDLQQVLRMQGSHFDREWVHEQLLEIYGSRDPRLSKWNELTSEAAS
jgi:hypothetical protein